ncbi:hypothetical protein MMC25_004405 [Agyrium rufum]|nr:hypothetical protein [Agyrium rufum]
MDNLPTPEGCKPQVREIPYLGLAPRYGGLGFTGFSKRHSRNPEELITSHSILQWRADLVESFIQEWLWFGLLDGFAKACNIRIDLDDFVTVSPSGVAKSLTTVSLYDVYSRRIAIRKLDQYAVSMVFEMGDFLRLPYEPSKDVKEQIFEFWTAMIQHNPFSSQWMIEGLETLSNINNNTPDDDDDGKKNFRWVSSSTESPPVGIS